MMMDSSPKSNDPSWLRESEDRSSPMSELDKSQASTSSVLIQDRVRPMWMADDADETSSVTRKPKRKELVEQASFCCCPSDPVLIWFRMFHCLAGATGIACIGVNAYALSNPFIQLVDIVLHCYAILLGVLIIIIEADWRYILSRMRVMDGWIARGLFHVLVGFLTMENEAVDVKALRVTPFLVVGTMQVFFGTLYCVMGITCLKAVETDHWEKYDTSAKYVEVEVGP